MTTNATIIDDALSDLGVIEEGGNANSDQYTQALRVLNQMMESENASGDFDLGYFAQTDETDTIPIPLWAEDGITAMLAVRLAPKMRVGVPEATLMRATYSKSDILANIINHKLTNTDMSHLPQGSGRINSRYNINTDSS